MATRQGLKHLAGARRSGSRRLSAAPLSKALESLQSTPARSTENCRPISTVSAHSSKDESQASESNLTTLQHARGSTIPVPGTAGFEDAKPLPDHGVLSDHFSPELHQPFRTAKSLGFGSFETPSLLRDQGSAPSGQKSLLPASAAAILTPASSRDRSSGIRRRGRTASDYQSVRDQFHSSDHVFGNPTRGGVLTRSPGDSFSIGAAIPHSTVTASSTRFRRPVSTSPRSSASAGHGLPASSVRAESGASSTTASAAAGFSTDFGGRGSGVSAATPAQSAPAGSGAHGPSGGATSGDRAARIAGEELAEECDEAVEDLGEVRARVRATREAVSKGRGVVRASLLLVLAVLSRTWQLLLAVPRGISSVARMSAADWSGTFKGWWKAIKHGAHHYWVGSKLLWADVRISSRLMLKAANGKALTRRERQQLTRTSADIFRLVPFAVFVIVPFLEFLLPLALRLFPNMLPSTFQDKNKEEEKLKRRLQARLEMARFLQGTVGEMAKEVKSRRSGEVKRTAEELQKFMKKVNTGGRVTNEEIVAFASLFNDELTLDNMSRPRLVSMCKYMGLQTFGTDAYLRYILRAKLAWIKEDDKMIQSEGVESLSEGELRAACRERGMLGLRSVDDMRKQLRDWLDLALNRSVPSSLLILSRAFLVGSKRPEEAVQATLSSLPAEVVRSVGATVPSDDEAETSARLRKLKLIKEQERLIEEEAQEAARLQLAGGRDLAREEMSEALPTPAATTTTTTATPAGAAAAAAPAAGVVGAGAGGAAVEGVAVEGEEARALAERKALAKKDQLCDLSAALAVLASSSSVAKERADFLRLVNKEIELYNSMVQQHGTEGAEELRVAYAAAREASEKEASEAAASDVSDALISKVDSMLHKLEKELDSADAKIGKRLKTLDTDYDGKVSPEEVGAAAALLRDSLGQEGLEELISNLAKDADGKILVEDIVKLGAHAQVSMDRDDDTDSKVQGGIKGGTGSSSGTGPSASGK